MLFVGKVKNLKSIKKIWHIRIKVQCAKAFHENLNQSSLLQNPLALLKLPRPHINRKKIRTDDETVTN